jgi:uncharacterized protein (DUF362 family)
MNSSTPNVFAHFLNRSGYHATTPHDPPERYAEYQGASVDPGNHVYAAVRETLRLAGLDRERFGTPEWNPFGEIVKPGMTVFVKLNTVSDVNLAGRDLFSVIVHSSILRPILDYVCRALKGKGRIIIGDSQVIYARYEEAIRASGIADLLNWYRQQTAIPIECFDLRIVRGARSWMFGRWARPKVEQDPRGYQVVDLGEDSYFEGIDPNKLRIAIASYKNMRKYHAPGKHQYVIPRSFLESDVVINVPKLKTHRRTAITLCLKNFMGIPALKDSLPHFMIGAPSQGGDQYINPSKRKEAVLWLHDQIQTHPLIPVKFFFAVVKRLLWETQRIVPFKDTVYEAMWPGNDTLWRTLLDINRIVAYADKHGKMSAERQRSQFHLIDGIVGGEGDGPLSTDAVDAKVLIAGRDAASVDAVGATLMGFDISKIPLITKAFEDVKKSRPVPTGRREDIRVSVDGNEMSLDAFEDRYNLRFSPHPAWVGGVERTVPAMAPASR